MSNAKKRHSKEFDIPPHVKDNETVLAKRALLLARLAVLFGQNSELEIPPTIYEDGESLVWNFRRVLETGLHLPEHISDPANAEGAPTGRSTTRESLRASLLQFLSRKLADVLKSIAESPTLRFRIPKFRSPCGPVCIGPVHSVNAHSAAVEFAQAVLVQLRVAVDGPVALAPDGRFDFNEYTLQLPHLPVVERRLKDYPRFESPEYQRTQMLLQDEANRARAEPPAPTAEVMTFYNRAEMATSAKCCPKTITNFVKQKKIRVDTNAAGLITISKAHFELLKAAARVKKKE